jgi:hypothetical protein
MTQYVCRYPDGMAGLALLLLRAGLACVAFGVAASLPAAPAAAAALPWLAGVAAALLLAGFGTRWVALLLAVAAGVALAMHAPLRESLLLAGHLAGCLVAALIGPGAFSIDARRHGRRVIHLQAHAPDRGAGD